MVQQIHFLYVTAGTVLKPNRIEKDVICQNELYLFVQTLSICLDHVLTVSSTCLNNSVFPSDSTIVSGEIIC